MTFLFILLVVVTGLLTALAVVPALKEKSWKRFFAGIFLSFFGILLPLVFFVLSALLTPEAKPLCHHGPFDCFHTGKLALTPFVLWASAALYAVEIYRVQKPTRAWIVQGLILGAIISTACTVFGFIAHCQDGGALVCLSVPLYTSIWYSARAFRAIRNQPPEAVNLTVALGSSLPFWALSVFWSYKTYLSLPDQVSDCFVVTAASRGHRKIVGPLSGVIHGGRQRLANQQLATLWAFEALWCNASPRSHAAFRLGYNVIGPILARRITSPWVADAFYIALKPAEFFARCILCVGLVRHRPRHFQILQSQ